MQLFHWLMNSAAWRSLNVYERGLYVEFKLRYNGTNNGDIAFSGDEMAAALGCSNRPADHARDKLIARGFIKVTRHGHFDWKSRGEHRSRASTYLLTEHSIDYPQRVADAATKDFMRWRSEADDVAVEKKPQRVQRKKRRGAQSTPVGRRDHPIFSDMGRRDHPNGVTASPGNDVSDPLDGVRRSPAYNIPPTHDDFGLPDPEGSTSGRAA